MGASALWAVAVAGAGWGGVYFAWRLCVDTDTVPCGDICIFESNTEVGGRAATITEEDETLRVYREWRATPQPYEEPRRTVRRPPATREAASHGRRGVWSKIRGTLGIAAAPSRAGFRLARANPLYSVDPFGDEGEDDALLSDAFFGTAGRQTSRTPFLGPEADVESEI